CADSVALCVSVVKLVGKTFTTETRRSHRGPQTLFLNAWRRWPWVGEVRSGNGIRHGTAIDIWKDRTPLSPELYQVILGHTFSRSQFERHVSIVPALPAHPVVPALG